MYYKKSVSLIPVKETLFYDTNINKKTELLTIDLNSGNLKFQIFIKYKYLYSKHRRKNTKQYN